ncbi:MAG: hypothetical protein OXI51_08455 [Chloroflexota bacterium]|nr:hypothetical protein [Chloroflexota bacterium]
MSLTTPSTAESNPDDRIIDASDFDSPGFLQNPHPLYRPALIAEASMSGSTTMASRVEGAMT